MANPQPCPFIKISKEYMDALRKVPLAPIERQILDTIIFHTWGNNPSQKEAIITNKDFMEENMIKFHSNVSVAIKGLLEKNMITRTGENPRKPIYSIQKDYEKWELGDKNPCKPASLTLCSNFTTKKVGSKITTNEKEDTDIQNKKSFRSNFTTKPAETINSVALTFNNEKKEVKNENSLCSKITTKEDFHPININKRIYVAESDTSNSLFQDEKLQEPKKEKTESVKVKKNNDTPYEERVKICEHFKNITGAKNCNPDAKGNKGFINARWKEGYKTEDFIMVIDYKFQDWKDNPEMSKYIRIETLFGNKFESYLNEAYKFFKKQEKKPPEIKKISDSDIEDILYS